MLDKDIMCDPSYLLESTGVNMYQLFILYLRLYLSISSCGIMDICIIIYSDIYTRLFRKLFLKSTHMYLDLMSEMAMFTCSFIVVKSDMGVLSSPV